MMIITCWSWVSVVQCLDHWRRLMATWITIWNITIDIIRCYTFILLCVYIFSLKFILYFLFYYIPVIKYNIWHPAGLFKMLETCQMPISSLFVASLFPAKNRWLLKPVEKVFLPVNDRLLVGSAMTAK